MNFLQSIIPSHGRKAIEGLSPHQLTALVYVAEGYTDQETGKAINRGKDTISSHVKSAMAKLGAKTRSHAVAIALSKGIISLNPCK